MTMEAPGTHLERPGRLMEADLRVQGSRGVWEQNG